MREILFRGRTAIVSKEKYNGEWLYGNLIQTDSGNFYIGSREVSPLFQLVIPETVGQYTGIDDRNGKKIFEGDIVSFTRINALGYTTKRVGTVKYYDKLPIFYIMATTGDAWDWVECGDIEVIGNIHDNPELLEVLK